MATPSIYNDEGSPFTGIDTLGASLATKLGETVKGLDKTLKMAETVFKDRGFLIKDSNFEKGVILAEASDPYLEIQTSVEDVFEDGTCVLEEGHTGDHEFIPNEDITITFQG